MYAFSRHLLLLLAGAALVFAGCAEENLFEADAPGSALEVEGPESLPAALKSFEGTFTVSPENVSVGPAPEGRCPGGYYLVSATGRGTATYLDRFVARQTHCQNEAGDIVRIRARLKRTSDGDVLRAVGKGSAEPVSGQPGVYRGVGHYEIKGGTGQFEGAGGHFTVTAVREADGKIKGTLEGEISF